MPPVSTSRGDRLAYLDWLRFLVWSCTVRSNKNGMQTHTLHGLMPIEP